MAFRVMIVDDDPVQLEVLRGPILNLPFEVEEPTHADSAHSALVHLGAIEPASWPDLILSDVKMPGMDGWAFVQSLRSHPKYDRIKVVMSTSEEPDHPETGVKALVVRYRADGYLAKPATLDALVAVIDEVFARG